MEGRPSRKTAGGGGFRKVEEKGDCCGIGDAWDYRSGTKGHGERVERHLERYAASSDPLAR